MKWWVVAAILLLPTTGCQSDDSQSEQVDQTMVEVHASFLKSLCDVLRVDPSREDVRPLVVGQSDEEADATIDEAIATYCPEVALDGSTGQG